MYAPDPSFSPAPLFLILFLLLLILLVIAGAATLCEEAVSWFNPPPPPPRKKTPQELDQEAADLRAQKRHLEAMMERELAAAELEATRRFISEQKKK